MKHLYSVVFVISNILRLHVSLHFPIISTQVILNAIFAVIHIEEMVCPLQDMRAGGVMWMQGFHILKVTALGAVRVTSPTLVHFTPCYSLLRMQSGPMDLSRQKGVKKNFQPSKTGIKRAVHIVPKLQPLEPPGTVIHIQ